MLLRNSFQSIVVRDERGLLKIIAWFHAKSFFDLESVNLKLLRHHQQSIPHLSRDHVCCVHNPKTYNWLLGFGDFAQRNIFENGKKKSTILLNWFIPEVYFARVVSNEVEPKIDGLFLFVHTYLKNIYTKNINKDSTKPKIRSLHR